MSQHEKAAARLLKSARALIADEKNWVKGAYYCHVEGRSCYCMVGALDQAVDDNTDDYLWPGSPLHQTAANALLDALFDSELDGVSPQEQTIPNFNDAPTTTHEDVLKVYDLAIKTLEADNG